MECESTDRKMVATLQSRRDALEAKLREKTSELKKLCIQEAELTGILPPETPIEPGESPPVFRRKVGTAFTYPEILIDKLKSKEEEALAKLELECKIQTSIAEAALGLANDGNASKSIRRKHRLEYQRSQRRLAELEMRLTVLRQSIKSSNQLKQRKKPRPPLNVEVDCPDGPELGANELDNFKHADEPTSLSVINRDVIRNSHFYNSFGKSAHNYPQHPGYPNKCNWSRNQLYRRSVERTHHNSGCYDDHQPTWLEDSSTWRNTAPVGYFSNQCYTTLPNDGNRMKSRYGSLDRRHRNALHGSDFDPRHSSPSHASPTPSYNQTGSPVIYNIETTASRRSTQNCAPSPSTSSAIINAVLLPNQTYPENSLTRTQSLGNVEHPRNKSLDTHSLQEKVHETFQSNTLGRKVREKEWRETSLDSECYERRSHTPPLHPRASKAIESPVPQRPVLRHSAHTPPPPLPPPHNAVPASPPPVACKSPMKSPTLIESTVPFESPKNHTVVEVGKWQPYREVTKPFEMSDFYKYSTKFRKNNAPDSGKTIPHEVHSSGRGSAYAKSQNTFVENANANYPRSNEDVNKNNLMSDACYYDSSFMNNITQRRHRPLTVVNDCNENNANLCKPWTNE